MERLQPLPPIIPAPPSPEVATPALPNNQMLALDPNNQRRNSFEQLWAEVMQAQVRGDSKRAFRLLLEILRMKNLTPSQRELVKSEIRSSRQMIPWCIQRARKA